jgi:hypothetical protein
MPSLHHVHHKHKVHFLDLVLRMHIVIHIDLLGYPTDNVFLSLDGRHMTCSVIPHTHIYMYTHLYLSICLYLSISSIYIYLYHLSSIYMYAHLYIYTYTRQDFHTYNPRFESFLSTRPDRKQVVCLELGVRQHAHMRGVIYTNSCTRQLP